MGFPWIIYIAKLMKHPLRTHVLVYNVLRSFIEKPFVCRKKDNRIRLQLLDPIKTDSLNINMD